MEENLLPLLEEEAKLLRDITDAQNELTTARIERAEGMYISLLAILVGLVIVGIICSLIITKKLLNAMIPPLEQIRNASVALAQGATEQASSIEELSAAINEISASAQDNAKHTAMAMERSKVAGDHVSESARDIEEMVEAMQQITQSSQEIEKIIDTIEQIAFKTNILALNGRGNASLSFIL